MKRIINKLKVVLISTSLVSIPFDISYAEMKTSTIQSIRLLQKSNSNEYNELLSDTTESLKIYINKIVNDEIKKNKLKIVSQFLNICGDNDFADDVIITKNQDDKNHLVFTCFSGYDVKSGLSFIFDTDDLTHQITGFSQIEIVKNENSNIEFSDLKKTDQSNFKLILKESSVLVASAATSALAAKTIFTGQQDKPKHAVLSSLISSIVTSAAHHFFKLSPKKSALVGFSVCSAVGIGKEIWDKFHPGHTPDVQDFAADLIGCGSGSLGMSLVVEY